MERLENPLDFLPSSVGSNPTASSYHLKNSVTVAKRKGPPRGGPFPTELLTGIHMFAFAPASVKRRREPHASAF